MFAWYGGLVAPYSLTFSRLQLIMPHTQQNGGVGCAHQHAIKVHTRPYVAYGKDFALRSISRVR